MWCGLVLTIWESTLTLILDKSDGCYLIILFLMDTILVVGAGIMIVHQKKEGIISPILPDRCCSFIPPPNWQKVKCCKNSFFWQNWKKNVETEDVNCTLHYWYAWNSFKESCGDVGRICNLRKNWNDVDGMIIKISFSTEQSAVCHLMKITRNERSLKSSNL